MARYGAVEQENLATLGGEVFRLGGQSKHILFWDMFVQFFLARYVCINKANMEPEVCLARNKLTRFDKASGLKVNQDMA